MEGAAHLEAVLGSQAKREAIFAGQAPHKRLLVDSDALECVFVEPAPKLVVLKVEALDEPQEVNRLEERQKCEQEPLLLVHVHVVDANQVLKDLQRALVRKEVGGQYVDQHLELLVNHLEGIFCLGATIKR